MGVRRLARLATLSAFLAGAGGALSAAQPAGSGDLVDRILAVVEGRVVLLSDVRAFEALRFVEPVDTTGDATHLVLGALIERHLILSEVARYVAEAPSVSDVETRLTGVVERVGGAEAFDELLPRLGFVVDDVRQLVRDDLRIERYLARRFPAAQQPTEDEVAAYFLEHIDEFRTGGVSPSFEVAREDARRRLAAELRQELIDDWTTGLSLRADVFRVTP